MINDCLGNKFFIEQSAILEGAKIDWKLKNWLEEGEDYKNLKAEVKKVIEANNLDDDKLRSKGKGIMHACKRILQILEDISVVTGSVDAVYNIGVGIGTSIAGAPIVGLGMIGGTIIGFVIGFIINRLLRFAYDTAEFNAIKKDAQDIVKDLRRKARDTNDNKAAKKLNDEADRLENAIEKYSNKK